MSLKFREDTEGNCYTTCDYSGVNIYSVYQIPKPGSKTERFGFFADAACAVSYLKKRHRLNKPKTDYPKYLELLQLVVDDLRLVAKKKELVEAPAMKADAPDFSYREKYPWMYTPEIHVPASYLKEISEQNKKKEKDISAESKDKNHIYTLDPESGDLLCQVFEKNTPHFIAGSPEATVVSTTFKGKDVFLLGNTLESSGEFNGCVQTHFKNVTTSFYGPVRILSRKALLQGNDEENLNLITSLETQKQKGNGKNIKTNKTQEIIEKYLESQNILPPTTDETSPKTTTRSNKRARTESATNQ